jgi:hypothetical protein
MLTCARYAQLRRCAADAYRRCMRAPILQELVRTNERRRACARGHDSRMHKKHAGMNMETHACAYACTRIRMYKQTYMQRAAYAQVDAHARTYTGSRSLRDHILIY